MPENPSAWLMATAKNRAIDVLKVQKKDGPSKSELSDSTSHIFDGSIPVTEDLYDVFDRRDL